MELHMRSGKIWRRGFTFVELMVVIAIMVILISMAIPQLLKSITHSKEAVLQNNLYTLRSVIEHYSLDKGKAPQSLTDLVTDGYLRAVPTDPMNNNSSDWKTDMEEASSSSSSQEPGIWNVHSMSSKTSLDGRPYSEW
jgi:general secretion pathway protein G